MPYAPSGPARIYYEVLGEESAPVLLLVGGFSAQITGWQDGFCRLLVHRGFRVVRFDNRDVGLSSQFDGEEGRTPGYSLHDMAADGFAVLDHLGVDSFHLVGQSMGGMIAQSMAGSEQDRVLSLTLVFTAPWMTPDWFPTLALVADMRFEPVSRGVFIAAILEEQRLNATEVYAFEEAWVRAFAESMYDRCHRPDGVERQLRAMLLDAGQPFTDHARLTMPVVLLHGQADVRVRVGASIALMRLIPHAEVHLYPGMGHFVVEPLWNEFADIVARTASRGQTALAAAASTGD